MKIQTILLTSITAAVFVLAGCSKPPGDTSGGASGGTPSATPSATPSPTANSTGVPTVVSVDTAKIEAAFAAADADTKKALEPVIAAVKSTDFAGVVTQLKALGEKFKLTDEQQAAVNDLMAQAQKAIADLAARANGDATKAATDMTKTLGK